MHTPPLSLSFDPEQPVAFQSSASMSLKQAAALLEDISQNIIKNE
jgi:hypothetical protein